MENVFADLDGLMGKPGDSSKGNWREFFKDGSLGKIARAKARVVLELGCGAGHYTISLAQKYPKKNFIGIDRKGDRIWRGAKKAMELKLKNVFFMQARAEHLERYFKKSEVGEIWITFPDPYPKPSRAGHRLTSHKFTPVYKLLLKKGGKVHLKTDNLTLFEYSIKTLTAGGFKLQKRINDVHGRKSAPPLLKITTYYEQKWMSKGKPIHYACFSPIAA